MGADIQELRGLGREDPRFLKVAQILADHDRRVRAVEGGGTSSTTVITNPGSGGGAATHDILPAPTGLTAAIESVTEDLITFTFGSTADEDSIGIHVYVEVFETGAIWDGDVHFPNAGVFSGRASIPTSAVFGYTDANFIVYQNPWCETHENEIVFVTSVDPLEPADHTPLTVVEFASEEYPEADLSPRPVTVVSSEYTLRGDSVDITITYLPERIATPGGFIQGTFKGVRCFEQSDGKLYSREGEQPYLGTFLAGPPTEYGYAYVTVPKPASLPGSVYIHLPQYSEDMTLTPNLATIAGDGTPSGTAYPVARVQIAEAAATVPVPTIDSVTATYQQVGSEWVYRLTVELTGAALTDPNYGGTTLYFQKTGIPAFPFAVHDFGADSTVLSAAEGFKLFPGENFTATISGLAWLKNDRTRLSPTNTKTVTISKAAADTQPGQPLALDLTIREDGQSFYPKATITPPSPLGDTAEYEHQARWYADAGGTSPSSADWLTGYGTSAELIKEFGPYPKPDVASGQAVWYLKWRVRSINSLNQKGPWRESVLRAVNASARPKPNAPTTPASVTATLIQGVRGGTPEWKIQYAVTRGGSEANVTDYLLEWVYYTDVTGTTIDGEPHGQQVLKSDGLRGEFDWQPKWTVPLYGKVRVASRNAYNDQSSWVYSSMITIPAMTSADFGPNITIDPTTGQITAGRNGFTNLNFEALEVGWDYRQGAEIAAGYGLDGSAGVRLSGTGTNYCLQIVDLLKVGGQWIARGRGKLGTAGQVAAVRIAFWGEGLVWLDEYADVTVTSTSWQTVEVVSPVAPATARYIGIQGYRLAGSGYVYFDNFEVEPVPLTDPNTGLVLDEATKKLKLKLDPGRMVVDGSGNLTTLVNDLVKSIDLPGELGGLLDPSQFEWIPGSGYYVVQALAANIIIAALAVITDTLSITNGSTNMTLSSGGLTITNGPSEISLTDSGITIDYDGPAVGDPAVGISPAVSSSKFIGTLYGGINNGKSTTALVDGGAKRLTFSGGALVQVDDLG